MAHFAVIENGVVTNVIIADNLPTAILVTNKTCIEYEPSIGAVGIGWTYENNLFTPPTQQSLEKVDTINTSAYSKTTTISESVMDAIVKASQ